MHWANFGQAPGASFHQDEHVAWTVAPIADLPYNAVLKTDFPEEPEAHVREVIGRFESRNVRFIWVVNPSARPANLGDLLVQCGLSLIARETAMVWETRGRGQSNEVPPGPIRYAFVEDEEGLLPCEELIMEYWTLSVAARPYVRCFLHNAFRSGNRGIWILAFKEQRAVGKVYLSLLGEESTASVWGVYVRPEARGFGVGSTLTQLAMDKARDLGRKWVLLISTQMGMGVYHRLGFKDLCSIPVFANTPVLPALQGIQPV